MSNIACLLFDLDGTLFDSTEANIASYAAAFESVGLPFDEALYRQSFGLRFDDMCDKLAPAATDEQRSQIQAQKTLAYKANLGLVRANTGLLSLLESARPRYKTALVTTARRENALNLLAYFRIHTGNFDCIIAGEDVSVSKPDPTCYLTAMERLGLSPEACCIFEDSDVGIQAAELSGAYVIKVAI